MIQQLAGIAPLRTFKALTLTPHYYGQISGGLFSTGLQWVVEAQKWHSTLQGQLLSPLKNQSSKDAKVTGKKQLAQTAQHVASA